MHRRSFLTVCGAASLSAACARLSTVAGQLDEGRMVVDRRELGNGKGRARGGPELESRAEVAQPGLGPIALSR